MEMLIKSLIRGLALVAVFAFTAVGTADASYCPGDGDKPTDTTYCPGDSDTPTEPTSFCPGDKPTEPTS